ncbi:MAG: branched-chain amino acid ABC transporter permease [Rhizobiales bacterium]|nr:branched-chain amino acid ABC transporter permease [Hyphomicrobiales bacterium]
MAVVLFDGFAFGMLLFVLSVGLSVTFGLMNFINLAHCAFGMLGGYVTVIAMRAFGVPFLFALPLAFLAAGLVSVVLERSLFRRLYRAGELNQVLFTIGMVFVAAASFAYFFGTGQQPIVLPDYLQGYWEVHGLRFGTYRIFLVAISLVIAGLLVGLDVDTIFAITFALGAGLAGLGGALAIGIVGLDPSFGFHYLVYVLIVVAVGGLGSIGGSFVAAAALGIFDVAGKYFVPDMGAFLIYLFMVVLLLVRPLGLFGKR